MNLPEITHLQFLVLNLCQAERSGEISGRRLRELMKQAGVKKTGPGFYQMMARLEDAGMVKGWYEQRLIDGQPIKERTYKLTAKGVRIKESTQVFYASQAGMLGVITNG